MNEKLSILEKLIQNLEQELQGFKNEIARLNNTEGAEACRRMSERIVPAYEVYEKIRCIAQTKEGIRFNGIRGGIFADLLRKSKHYSGYIKRTIANGESLVSEKIYEECLNGRHPQLYRLLTSEDSHNIELIKAAILEEIDENNFLTAKASSYRSLEKFKKLVESFEE